MALLSVRDLVVTFDHRDHPVKALDGLSFSVDHGEKVGVIGESGSGKSMVCLAIQGLQPQVASVSGSISFEGREIVGAPDEEVRSLRGLRLGAVFQEPMTALNPVVPLWRQLTTASLQHGLVTRSRARARAVELAAMVGLPEPHLIVDRYPHQLSGGQRQRVVIAMALSAEPVLVLADEPTTALDATVARRVLQLMSDLCDQMNSALILVTHDIGVAASTSERILVMRQGRLVEERRTTDLLRDPRAEYTRGLVAAAASTSLDLEGARRALSAQSSAQGSAHHGKPNFPQENPTPPHGPMLPAPTSDRGSVT